MEFIKIGQIIKPFGLKGELKVYPYTDFKEDRFKKGNTVYLEINDDKIPYVINSYKEHKGLLLIQFKGYEDINLIENYHTIDIYFDKSKIKPLKDGYYIYQLKNLEVYDQNNNYIGIVIDVENGLAHNNLRIKTNDKTILVPNIPNFVLDVDLSSNKMIINVIEGLI